MNVTMFGDWAQGAMHRRAGLVWQDHFRKIEYIKGVSIAAVADGHGSSKCPRSDEGARIATKVFCNIMADYYNKYDDLDKLRTFLCREGDMTLAKEIERAWKQEVMFNFRESQKNSDFAIEDNDSVYLLYGTTLLGIMLTDDYAFVFRIGDGNIVYADAENTEDVLKIQAKTISPECDNDVMLGVETHSLSGKDAWKHAEVKVITMGDSACYPCMYMLSTDGFANSYKDNTEFMKTCHEYFEMIGMHGVKVIRNNLRHWLEETSEEGCGDDITAVFVYLSLKKVIQN